MAATSARKVAVRGVLTALEERCLIERYRFENDDRVAVIVLDRHHCDEEIRVSLDLGQELGSGSVLD